MGPKTRMMGLRGREKNFDIFSRFDTIHECDRQRDRQTDRQTDRHRTTASRPTVLCIMSCGKKELEAASFPLPSLHLLYTEINYFCFQDLSNILITLCSKEQFFYYFKTTSNFTYHRRAIGRYRITLQRQSNPQRGSRPFTYTFVYDFCKKNNEKCHGLGELS